MFHLESKIRPDVSFAINQCESFTHNTKKSHETAVKSIFRYFQGTKNNGMVLESSKKIVVDCYFYANFVGLWEHGIPPDPIFDSSRNRFVITFFNCNILWVSNI